MITKIKYNQNLWDAAKLVVKNLQLKIFIFGKKKNLLT